MSRHRRASLALNLTPLIDIVFLLLVFFMLTAHFVDEQSLAIDLPESEAASSSDAPKELIDIIVDAKGVIHIKEQAMSLAELEIYIRTNLAAKPKTPVRLRGDTNTALQQVVAIMDVARKAGAESLDILTEQP